MKALIPANDTLRELTPSETDQVSGGILNNVAGVGAGQNGVGTIQGTQLAGAALAIVQTQAFAGVSGVA
jgi:hypothetical protein